MRNSNLKGTAAKMDMIIGLKTDTTGTLKISCRTTRKLPLKFRVVLEIVTDLSKFPVFMFYIELFSPYYLLSWHRRANWSKLYGFVRFTHRIKLNFINVFLGCICRLCKQFNSLISQVIQLYLSICFLKIILRNASFLLKTKFFEIPRFNNYPSWCNI